MQRRSKGWDIWWLPQEWNRKLVAVLQLSAPSRRSAACWCKVQGVLPQEWNRKWVAEEEEEEEEEEEAEEEAEGGGG